MPPINRAQLKQLICGILTLIRHCDGSPTKTKLLKLVYLADVESCRDRAERITDLEWIFHLYGPWTYEYDPLLAEMEQEDLIQLRGDHGAGDATFVNLVYLVDLEKIPLPVSTYLAVRQMTERWANAPTNELLDYVYFETEPMSNAIRGEPLDFRSIKPRNDVPLYRSAKSDASEKEIARMRRKFQESSAQVQRARFTKPRYDAAFFQAVSSANLEDE